MLRKLKLRQKIVFFFIKKPFNLYILNFRYKGLKILRGQSLQFQSFIFFMENVRDEEALIWLGTISQSRFALKAVASNIYLLFWNSSLK